MQDLMRLETFIISFNIVEGMTHRKNRVDSTHESGSDGFFTERETICNQYVITGRFWIVVRVAPYVAIRKMISDFRGIEQNTR